MRISVFGLGYVGCVSMACLANDDDTIVGVDPNISKVDAPLKILRQAIPVPTLNTTATAWEVNLTTSVELYTIWEETGVLDQLETIDENLYDVILDIADASTYGRSRSSLTDTGRYVSLYISLDVLFQMARTAVFGGPKAMMSIAMPSRENVQAVRDLLLYLAHGFALQLEITYKSIARRTVVGHRQAHGQIIFAIDPHINNVTSRE